MINKPILLHYYYIRSLFRCPLFLPNIHSKIPSGYHITFSHQVSRLLWAVTVSQTFLMLDDLYSSKETALIKYFVRCPSIGIFPMFPSLLDQAMGYWEEDHKDGVPFSSHHFEGTYYQHDLSLSMLTLITWLRSCLAGFSTRKWLISPLSTLYSSKGSHYLHSLHVRSEDLRFILEGNVPT